MKVRNENTALFNHELRTPITSMIDIINKMSIENNNQSMNQSFEKLQEITNHLLETVNLVLNTEKNIYEKDESNFLITTLFEDVRIILDPIARSRNQIIKFNVNNIEDVIIKSDYNILKMICINFVSNAIKYSRKNTDINITSFITFKKSNAYFNIEFLDSGLGIEKYYLKNIFNSKFICKNRVDSSGLGLHIVKRLIKSLDGNIKSFSSVGIGTTFLLSIPITQSSIYEEDKIKNKNVLFIDDDFCLCEVYKSLLTPLLNTYSINDEVNIFDNKYDLIVIDYHIEKLNLFNCSNGVSLAKYIKSKCSAKILIISSNNKKELFSNKLPENIDGFMEKPLSTSLFKNIIYDILINKKQD